MRAWSLARHSRERSSDVRGRELRAPRRSASMDRLEVVLLDVVGDLLAEHRSLHVGGAEMDAAPYSGVECDRLQP